MFQFTLPHGERRRKVVVTLATAKFQFTLPHGERLWCMMFSNVIFKVSIHAPAWGATLSTATIPR